MTKKCIHMHELMNVTNNSMIFSTAKNDTNKGTCIFSQLYKLQHGVVVLFPELRKHTCVSALAG